MLTAERLARIIGIIDDELVEKSETAAKKRPAHRGRYAALAACLCAAFLGVWGVNQFRMGASSQGSVPGTADSPDNEYAESPGSGGFMSYAGPVMPLTLESGQSGLTAERELVFDFASYSDGSEYTAHADVTDTYTITNLSETDITVKAMYPFVGSLRELEELSPEVTVNGSTVQTGITAGSYAGGFVGTGDGTTDSMNLVMPRSAEEYSVLLSDGSYRAAALAELPLQEMPVTVYALENAVPPEGYYRANMSISFSYDSEKTQVLTYKMNGSGYDSESGEAIFTYIIDEWDKNGAYVILIGDDIEGYTLQGYESGACEPGEELDIECEVTRTETTMGSFLLEAVESHSETLEIMYGADNGITVPEAELYARAVTDLYISSGPLSQQPAERYTMLGRLDDLLDDAWVMERVFYAVFELTVPAGESVTVSALLEKDASFNWIENDDNVGVNGYDLFTSLDSSLLISSQRVRLSSCEGIELVSEDLGLSFSDGVYTAVTDTANDHYSFEIRSRAER